MPVPSLNRQPKFETEPKSGHPKTALDPETHDTETMAWNFHRLDREHVDWGWDRLKASQWRDFLAQLCTFEGLRWAELKAQAGGRRAGTNHHPLSIDELAADARKRLIELHLDDFSTVFSMRLNNTLRIYGVRDGRVLRIIWYDPHHGTAKGVCPTKAQKKKSQS